MLLKQPAGLPISCQERIRGEALEERWALEWEVTPPRFSTVLLTWVPLLGQDQSRTELGEGCAGWSEGVPRFLAVLGCPKSSLQAGRTPRCSSETGDFPLSLLRLGTTRYLTASLASCNKQEYHMGKIHPH